MMKVTIIGRHKFGAEARAAVVEKFGEGVEFEQVNPTFHTAEGAEEFIRGHNGVLVFQSVAPHIAVAMARIERASLHNIGVVFSVPGARPPAETREFSDVERHRLSVAKDRMMDHAGQMSAEGVEAALSYSGTDALQRAVEFANPRAQIESISVDYGSAHVVRVTVEAPMPFEFDHIEWIGRRWGDEDGDE